MPCVKSKRSSPMGNDCLLHKHIPPTTLILLCGLKSGLGAEQDAVQGSFSFSFNE